MQWERGQEPTLCFMARSFAALVLPFRVRKKSVPSPLAPKCPGAASGAPHLPEPPNNFPGPSRGGTEGDKALRSCLGWGGEMGSLEQLLNRF